MSYKYIEKHNIWKVELRVNGKKKYFGSFKTENEAKTVFEEKSKEIMSASLPNDISEFRDISGYNGYKISKDGRIISFSKNTSKSLLIRKDKRGYHRVMLCNEYGKKEELLHRLLYTAFIGKIPNGMFVDHIDRDKSNNNLENLRIVTPSQNSINSNNVDRAKGYHKNGSWWQAVICYGGERHYIGNFKTEEEARSAYLKEKKEHHLMPE